MARLLLAHLSLERSRSNPDSTVPSACPNSQQQRQWWRAGIEPGSLQSKQSDMEGGECTFPKLTTLVRARVRLNARSRLRTLHWQPLHQVGLNHAGDRWWHELERHLRNRCDAPAGSVVTFSHPDRVSSYHAASWMHRQKYRVPPPPRCRRCCWPVDFNTPDRSSSGSSSGSPRMPRLRAQKTKTLLSSHDGYVPKFVRGPGSVRKQP